MPSHTAANKPDTALPIPVRALQRLLHMDHFTGHYDDATRNAVRTLQRLKDLPITGEVDAATLAAIRASQPELEAMKRARHCVITTPLSQRDPGCLCEGGLRPLIVIDPGHGRYKDAQGRTVHDSGTLAGQKPEAEINLAVAKKLAANLRAEGFDVQLTRESDTQVLPSRFAARWDVGAGRKVFHISLHCESNPAADSQLLQHATGAAFIGASCLGKTVFGSSAIYGYDSIFTSPFSGDCHPAHALIWLLKAGFSCALGWAAS